ncbi:hypothetical protein [Marinobacterium aestuariivivens]|uniref:Transposase n=1 Tax=Marinobacterium aestuariivivens TaxID=1698799 RepID=A0ABW2A0U1_9GAMM
MLEIESSGPRYVVPDNNNKAFLPCRDPAGKVEDFNMVIWQHLLKARRCAHLSTGGPARTPDSYRISIGAIARL